MATINGARAMGLEEKIGSLEIGKQADIIAIDMSSLDLQPIYNPASQLVYSNIGHRVTHSWVNGKCLMRDRELLTVNEREIANNIRNWQEKIAK
jgi:5-methylthioadenosine/S-adenosylhomocysteine deaminase